MANLLETEDVATIRHELEIELTGYQSELGMILFLAGERSDVTLTEEEYRRADFCTMRIDRLEAVLRIIEKGEING